MLCDHSQRDSIDSDSERRPWDVRTAEKFHPRIPRPQKLNNPRSGKARNTLLGSNSNFLLLVHQCRQLSQEAHFYRKQNDSMCRSHKPRSILRSSKLLLVALREQIEAAIREEPGVLVLYAVSNIEIPPVSPYLRFIRTQRLTRRTSNLRISRNTKR